MQLIAASTPHQYIIGREWLDLGLGLTLSPDPSLRVGRDMGRRLGLDKEGL